MMNWAQFHLFLINQLDQFRLSQSSKNFESVQDLNDSVVIPIEYLHRAPSQTPAMEFNASGGPSRSVNWHGFGDMYANFLIRELSDIPAKLGLVGYGAGVSKMTPRTFFQSVRSIPLAMAIGQAPRSYILFTTYMNDLRQGKFPGTDESIFI